MQGPSASKIQTVAQLGSLIRHTRKRQGLTQADAAALCGVGPRFLSDLENGKSTAHAGKVLQVLAGFGLEMTIAARGLPGR